MAKAGRSGQMIYLSGQEELDKQLRGLALAAQKKLFRKAARAAAKPVLQAARKNAPSQHKKFRNRDKQGRFKAKSKIGGSNLLSKSIKLRAIKRSRNGSIGVVVRIGDEMFKGKSFYGAFVELGTKKQRPQSFMRKAADTNRERVMNIFQQQIQKELSEEVGKT